MVKVVAYCQHHIKRVQRATVWAGALCGNYPHSLMVVYISERLRNVPIYVRTIRPEDCFVTCRYFRLSRHGIIIAPKQRDRRPRVSAACT